MTLAQARAAAAAAKVNIDASNQSNQAAARFINNVILILNGPYSSTINVDAFVAIQLPIYNALIADIKSKANAL